MTIRRLAQVLLIGAAFGLVLISALAAGNAVPASKAGRSASAISVDSKKPKPDCNAITLTTLVVGVNGTAGADLIVGGAGADFLSGSGGNDCIVGGGNDTFNGGSGTDVCIGGPGTDTHFGGCETLISIP